jgi:hypothetical protein
MRFKSVYDKCFESSLCLEEMELYFIRKCERYFNIGPRLEMLYFPCYSLVVLVWERTVFWFLESKRYKLCNHIACIL